MLNPKVVAVIGATETPDSVGRALMENLHSFGENLYPNQPKAAQCTWLKRRSHEIADVPAPVDLVVISTPAFTVPDVIAECEKAGVPGVSDHFGRLQRNRGRRSEARTRDFSRRGQMRDDRAELHGPYDSGAWG